MRAPRSRFLSLSATGLNLAERVRRSTVSFNLAESGAERAARWLKDQGAPPPGTAAIDPFSGTQALGAGTYSVSVLADPNNPGADRKAYTVTSTASVRGRQQQVKLVLKQSSFGKYAYFTDKEVGRAARSAPSRAARSPPAAPKTITTMPAWRTTRRRSSPRPAATIASRG